MCEMDQVFSYQPLTGVSGVAQRGVAERVTEAVAVEGQGGAGEGDERDVDFESTQNGCSRAHFAETGQCQLDAELLARRDLQLQRAQKQIAVEVR